MYSLLSQGRALLNPSTLTCHLVAAEYEAVKEETWSSKDMLQVSRLRGLRGQQNRPFCFRVTGASMLQPSTAAYTHQAKGHVLLHCAGDLGCRLAALSPVAEPQTAPVTVHLTASR